MASLLPLNNTLQLWRRNVHDILFPRFCYGCNVPCTYLCDQCFLFLRATEPRITLHPQPSHLAGTIACSRYHGLIKELIHALKYSGVQELALPLARVFDITILSAIDRAILIPPIIPVPIPLHPRRERERGFNQNSLLTRSITAITPFPTPLLERAMYTKSQTRLKKRERALNVHGAFSVVSSVPQAGTFLLIDDVATTSATLKEAATCLASHTKAPIWGCVLAYDDIH